MLTLVSLNFLADTRFSNHHTSCPFSSGTLKTTTAHKRSRYRPRRRQPCHPSAMSLDSTYTRGDDVDYTEDIVEIPSKHEWFWCGVGSRRVLRRANNTPGQPWNHRRRC